MVDARFWRVQLLWWGLWLLEAYVVCLVLRWAAVAAADWYFECQSYSVRSILGRVAWCYLPNMVDPWLTLALRVAMCVGGVGLGLFALELVASIFAGSSRARRR